jgi:hypothetical protein
MEHLIEMIHLILKRQVPYPPPAPINICEAKKMAFWIESRNRDRG